MFDQFDDAPLQNSASLASLMAYYNLNTGGTNSFLPIYPTIHSNNPYYIWNQIPSMSSIMSPNSFFNPTVFSSNVFPIAPPTGAYPLRLECKQYMYSVCGSSRDIESNHFLKFFEFHVRYKLVLLKS